MRDRSPRAAHQKWEAALPILGEYLTELAWA
jgi:hypothetical protein